MPHLLRSATLHIGLLITITALPSVAHGTPTPGATADEVMTSAKTQATAEHKNILLMFGASWCVNCHRFDKFLADPAVHPITDKAFVFVDMTTGEKPKDKHHANLPGGEKLQSSLGGKEAGWPYFVILDPTGKALADSKIPATQAHPGNIGYPAAPWEIDCFLDMLKRSAPTLTPQDTATIRTWLSTHGPNH